MKSIQYLAGGAVLALSLAGCHLHVGSTSSPSSAAAAGASQRAAGDSMASTTAPASLAPATASMAPTGTMAPSSAAPMPGVTHHPPRHCTDLGVQLGMASGTAGADYITIRFTNDAAKTVCTVDGYPGVALTTGKSPMDQVGAAAVKDTAVAPVKYTLAPGQGASALLKVADVNNFPAAQGHVVQATYIQVYAPESTVPQYLAVSYQGTTASSVKYLTVGPLVG